MQLSELTQLGAVAVIFLFAIREFFTWLKTRNSEKNGPALNESILQELRLMNSNHLHSIEDAIKDGNISLTGAIHADNIEIVKILGQIEGHLASRR